MTERKTESEPRKEDEELKLEKEKLRDLEPDGRLVDCVGLIDGAAGVALVLLAASSPVEPAWDRVFLLS